MRSDDIFLYEAYEKVYQNSETIEEAGLLSRIGARVGAVGGAAKQYGANLANTLAGGGGTGLSSKDAYQQSKQTKIIETLVKDVLTDFQKLGLLGKGYQTTPEDSKKLTDLFNQFLAGKKPTQQAASTQTQTSPADKEKYLDNVFDAKSGQWIKNGKPNPAQGSVMAGWKKSKNIA